MTGVGAMMASAAYGATTDTQSVTIATTDITPNRIRGYDASVPQGSISDGTSNIYGGAAINSMVFTEIDGKFRLQIAGALANSGWTTLSNVTDGTSLSRASATFSGAGPTTWTWTSTLTGFFTTNSGTKTITFT